MCDKCGNHHPENICLLTLPGDNEGVSMKQCLACGDAELTAHGEKFVDKKMHDLETASVN